jgi:putative adenylate-forming enzyme
VSRLGHLALAIGLISKLTLAAAYMRTKALHALLTNRSRIDRWQAFRLERLRRHAIARLGFYNQLRGIPFSDLPLIDKSRLMSEFEKFNTLGLTAQQVWKHIDQGDAPDRHSVGCSTGTSGNRGVYLVSNKERFEWLGTIIAKAIPDVLRRRHRVAIMLPRSSNLYDAANESRLVRLQFFDLGLGLRAVADAVAEFSPTIMVGPPKVLRWMADHGSPVRPQFIYASAEVLDPLDRRPIEDAFSVRLGQIYMATEGLFGVSCSHGTLHLAEDVVHFEFEPVSGIPGLVSPIVTDFTRRTQVMARYRMNDLLRLSHEPCPCGSAMHAVAEIVGRQDDCFILPREGREGDLVTITPDVLRNAVVGTDQSIQDFRIWQIGANSIQLVLPLGLDDPIAERARRAVALLCSNLECAPEVGLIRSDLVPDPKRKLRRVEQRWGGALEPGGQ